MLEGGDALLWAIINVMTSSKEPVEVEIVKIMVRAILEERARAVRQVLKLIDSGKNIAELRERLTHALIVIEEFIKELSLADPITTALTE